MSMRLRFLGVRTLLPERAEHEAVDLDLGSGRRVALIGGSGEGKSLLCKLALGLEPPPPLGRAGRLELDGEAIDPAALAALRAHRITWLPQGGRESLVPGWSLDRHLARLAPGGRRVEVLAAMQSLGLEPTEVLTLDALRLSEGMIRRFLLALALSGTPDLVVLDEPTAGLDRTSRQLVVDVVLQALGTRDTGLLLATHDLEVARALADTFVLVRDGAPTVSVPSLEQDGPLGFLVRAAAVLGGAP
jgi:ABC-type glutathione transport system ATPase component